MPTDTPIIRTDIPGSQHYIKPHSQQPQSMTVHHDEKRKLTVGSDITLSGEIASCDHLVVEGMVEAELHGGRKLDISPMGLFRGTVEIQDMDLAGTFEGNLIVFGKLTIRSTGRVVGNIQYGELEVHGGGLVEGAMAPLPPEIAQLSRPQGASTTPANTDQEKTEEKEPAAEDLQPEYKKAVGQ